MTHVVAPWSAPIRLPSTSSSWRMSGIGVLLVRAELFTIGRNYARRLRVRTDARVRPRRDDDGARGRTRAFRLRTILAEAAGGCHGRADRVRVDVREHPRDRRGDRRGLR